jgi:hypothetical protein
MHPHPDSAADLTPIGNLLPFICVPSARDGTIPPMYRADERVDTLALVRFHELSFMCEFRLATSGNAIRKPRHGD